MGNSTESLDSLGEFLESLYNVLFYGGSIAELGIGLVALIVGAIVAVLSSVLLYVATSLPHYRLAKKMGYKHAWLAWIPIDLVRIYMLCNIVGPKTFSLFGDKFKTENRTLSFWAYLGVDVFGDVIVWLLFFILNLIPFIGQILSGFTFLLNTVPAVIQGLILYVYMRDILDIFQENKKTNNIIAIVIAVLDSLVTGGLARTIYLYALWNKNPLPQAECNCQ